MRKFARRLAHDRSGVAYIEMALLAPVLLLMYCGSYVVSDMVTCGRKVSLTARTITDLTSQYGSVTPTDTAAVLSNAAYVLAPYNSANAGMRISEIQVTDASHATVIWSEAQNATALTKGSIVTLPANLAPPKMVPNTVTDTTSAVYNNGIGGMFIMGEISYAYTPAFGGGWLPSPTLYNRYFMLPRLTTTIPCTTC
jgi:Flp pilus assembly protein TadG